MSLTKPGLHCAADANIELLHVKTLVAVSAHMTWVCAAWLAAERLADLSIGRNAEELGLAGKPGASHAWERATVELAVGM